MHASLSLRVGVRKNCRRSSHGRSVLILGNKHRKLGAANEPWHREPLAERKDFGPNTDHK